MIKHRRAISLPFIHRHEGAWLEKELKDHQLGSWVPNKPKKKVQLQIWKGLFSGPSMVLERVIKLGKRGLFDKTDGPAAKSG